MVNGLFEGLLPTLLVTASLTTPYSFSATLQATNSAEIRESQYYSVKNGDSLSSIAYKIYGDEAAWTTLWNDNDWIENPQVIESGWKLKIRNTLTGVESLKPELQKKQQSVRQVSSETLVPPVTPSQSITPVSQEASVTSGPLTEAQIQFLGMCESGMTATRNSGNGYYGAFQFAIGTWKSMATGYERADLAPLDVQIDAVQRLVSRSSIFTQFPGCARKMQAAGLL